jgi:hypothetical protein
MAAIYYFDLAQVRKEVNNSVTYTNFVIRNGVCSSTGVILTESKKYYLPTDLKFSQIPSDKVRCKIYAIAFIDPFLEFPTIELANVNIEIKTYLTKYVLCIKDKKENMYKRLIEIDQKCLLPFLVSSNGVLPEVKYDLA